MVQVDSVHLLYMNSSLAFQLDAVEMNGTNTRVTESMEIPSLPWNTWFDNNIIEGQVTLSGTFQATDNSWNVAGNGYHGRPFDFIFQLTCALHGISSSTGLTLQPGSVYNGLMLELHQVFGGTEYTFNLTTALSGGSLPAPVGSQFVFYLLNKFTYDMKGGTPGAVDWTIVLDQVGIISTGVLATDVTSAVINFGRSQ